MTRDRSRHPDKIENDKLLLAKSRLTAAVAYGRSSLSPPAKKVAVLHFGRSGSTVLGQTVGAQPHLSAFWDGEVFQKLHRDEQLLLRLAGDPYRFLDWRSRRAKDLYGVEIKVNPGGHIDNPPLKTEPTSLVAALLQREYFVVYLSRQNHLRWALSAVAGRTRGRYHRTQAAPQGDPIDMPLEGSQWYGPAGTLRAYLEQARSRDAAIRAALQEVNDQLLIEFASEVAPDPNLAAEKLVAAVTPEVDYESIRPALQPSVGPAPLRSIISNHDEVRRHLEPAGLHYLLDG